MIYANSILHVLIDSSIYRMDPKRTKPAFRALTRLAQGGKVEIHLPFYVKQEFVTQQRQKIREILSAIATEAGTIVRMTQHSDLKSYSEATKKSAESIIEPALKWVADEFDNWLTKIRAVEHRLKPDHGQKVSDDYFSGAPPFTSSKHREDIPDSFIWQCALDLVQGGITLHFIARDGALSKAAKQNLNMVAYGTLDEFIQKPECQAALRELLENETIVANIERCKPILEIHKAALSADVEHDIVDALSGKTVRHRSIPDDNSEATILLVDGPEDLEFNFQSVEYYGDGELGIPFTALTNCTVYYSIFKGEYHTLPSEKAVHISIEELNDHFYDAEEEYTISVDGLLSIRLDVGELKREDLTEDDLGELINDADSEVEILEAEVYDPDE